MELVQLSTETKAVDDATAFSAEGLALLRAALQPRHPWSDETIEPSPALSAALRRICSDARRSEARPERFLVAFKTALQSAPAMRRLRGGPERDAYVARIVSLCIAEYYREPVSPDGEAL